MKKEQKKRKILFCEPCGYKEIVEVEDIGDEYQEIPDVPGGSPTLDPVTKKVVTKKGIRREKKKKCPKCGRGVFLKNLPAAYTKTIKSIEKREEKEKQESERLKRLEDGKPMVREKEFDE